MVASIHGSSTASIRLGSGQSAGLWMLCVSPPLSRTSYTTDGAVVMRSRSYSRVSRSWMISRWRRPRKPQRKPKPSAALVEGVAELLEIGGVDREEAAEDDRLDGLEAGEGLGRGALGVGDGVADA